VCANTAVEREKSHTESNMLLPRDQHSNRIKESEEKEKSGAACVTNKGIWRLVSKKIPTRKSQIGAADL